MIENNEEYIEKLDLLYTPLTRQLLAEYVGRKYEESADVSDEILKVELLWLYKNNLISELILCEIIYSDK